METPTSSKFLFPRIMLGLSEAQVAANVAEVRYALYHIVESSVSPDCKSSATTFTHYCAVAGSSKLIQHELYRARIYTL